MSKSKLSIDKLSGYIINVVAKPMIRLGEYPAVCSVRDGLVATVPFVILGSLLLLLAMLGQDNTFSTHALLPVITPYSAKMILFFQMTMGFVALYAAVAIGIVYAGFLSIDRISAALLSLASFILFNIDNVDHGMSISGFSAGGLFTAITSSLLSIRCYHLFVTRKFIIKMPEGVPPNVINAFVALIPYSVILTAFWLIRSCFGFDFNQFLNAFLVPFVNASDNIIVYTVIKFITLLLWGVGMHGDNMLSPVVSPMLLQWVSENAKAVADGVALTALPHIWTTVVDRLSMWPAAVWSVLFLMWRSPLKHARQLAMMATPASVFTIVEPIVFGLPLVLNPYLFVPFILSGTLGPLVTYAFFDLHLINRVFVELPWATPPFISGYIATGGDWMGVVVVIINFCLGVAIYYPFWKAWEKSQLNSN